MAAVKTGFNMLWCYSRWKDPLPREADERELDFIAEEGFNFIRVPADYRFFVPDGDFTRPREEALAFASHYGREASAGEAERWLEARLVKLGDGRYYLPHAKKLALYAFPA